MKRHMKAPERLQTSRLLLRRPRRELAWMGVLPALWLLPPLPAPEPGNERALIVQPAIADLGGDSGGWTQQRDAGRPCAAEALLRLDFLGTFYQEKSTVNPSSTCQKT